jgi:hypothetical protein
MEHMHKPSAGCLTLNTHKVATDICRTLCFAPVADKASMESGT